MRKKKRSIEIKIIPALIACGVFIILILNFYLQKKMENNIEKNVKNYKFKNSYLTGLIVDYKKVNCKGFLSYKCELSDVELKTELEDKTIKTFLISKKSILVPKEIKKGLSVELELLDIKLGKELENIIFNNYEEPYKTISENLKKYVFPSNLFIKIDVDKINKTEIIGEINLKIENNITNVNLFSNIYINLNKYDEAIEIKEVSEELKKEDLKAELLSKDVPFFGKINNFKYNVEDQNFKNFLYEIYKLNALNLYKENKDKLIGFNYYYLGEETADILEKEEFEKSFLNMLKKYKELIPEDEKHFKKILTSVEKLLKKEVKKIEIIGKNINNTSIEKTGLLVMIDNFNTSKRYLDESFDIEIIEYK